MTSPATQHPLWHALLGFTWNDDGHAWTFAQRLGTEHGWSTEYTVRVLEEYRRFLFLACVAGHPVTPSIDVDEAWHLHLVYTESYWNDLCQNTLGRPLHHGPTRGGRLEDLKYADWYSQTRISYEKWFYHRPPGDIWPDNEQRFSTANQYRTVRRGDYFLLPRRWSLGHPSLAMLALLCFSITLMAFSESSEGLLIFGGFLIVALLIQVIIAALRKRKRKNDRRGGSDCGGGGCASNSGSQDSGCASSGCSSSGCGGGGCGGGD